MGATVAASTHVTKAGSRAAINTSPEPFSNSAMSLAEGGLVVGLGFLTLVVPIVALLVTVALLVLIFIFSRRLYVGAKRRFSSRA
jgi:4-amino-4-deoxy-L-arabinose transferase-like glycosyltransferase